MNKIKIKFLKKKLKDFNYPVKEILLIESSLNKINGEVRLIGGVVRDILLDKRISKDIDLVTNLEPKKIINCLKKSKINFYETGLKFGCITVEINKKKIEITSLRRDIKKKGRWPKVEYTLDWKEDASRRDFTINSIYVDLKGNIYDPFDGVDDLKNRKVRFVGNPSKRIKEDFLRILRFFRFSIQFAKEFDKQGLSASLKLMNNVSDLSFERRFDELNKILTLIEFEKEVIFFSENSIIDQIFGYKVNTNNISKLFSFERKLNKVDKKRRFKFFIKDFQDLSNQKFSKVIKKEDFNRFKVIITFKNFNLLEIKKQVYNFGLINVIDQLFFDATQNLISFKKLESLLLFAESWEVPEFSLQGDDLKKLGFKPGKEMGLLIKKTESWWIKNDFKPDKFQCINFIKENSPGN